MSTKRRRRTNYDKQENVVSAIWEFAHNQQTHEHTVTNSKGTSVHIDSVGVALKKIMDIFGYDVTPVL